MNVPSTTEVFSTGSMGTAGPLVGECFWATGCESSDMSTKKTWAIYKTSLVHIKNGCVSDAPGVTYYIEIGVDSTGMPLFKCIRGTSALEGFHQKIRQLLRGFNFSPRLAIAILHDYIYRWNIGLAVSARGLPGKYGGWYSHHFIEELQDVSLSWNLSPGLHSEWTSSKLFKPLGEEMGFINAPAVFTSHSSNSREGDIM